MDNSLFWLFTLKVQSGKFDEFKTLVADIVTASKKEPGTLAYQYSVSSDKNTVHIYERYRDSQAFVDHISQTFSAYAKRFLELVSVESLVVYGEPNAEARKALDSFNAVYMTLFDGFSHN